MFIEFIGKKSEKYKKENFVDAKEILEKDVNYKKSKIFQIIGKSVNNLVKFIDNRDFGSGLNVMIYFLNIQISILRVGFEKL